MQGFPEFPQFDFEHHFSFDTLGPHAAAAQWTQFSEEFQKNFKEKFGDFYEQHEEELKEIMDKVHEQVDGNLQSGLRSLNNDNFQVAAADLAKEAQRMAEHARQWQKQNELQLRQMQMEARAMENHRKEIDEKFGKELTKDGYIKEGEEINNIHISDSEIEINGKKIKDAHYKKYKAMFGELKPPAPPKFD
jgi:hypothetical protein